MYENHARQIKEEQAKPLNKEQARKMKEKQARKTKEDIKRKRRDAPWPGVDCSGLWRNTCIYMYGKNHCLVLITTNAIKLYGFKLDR